MLGYFRMHPAIYWVAGVVCFGGAYVFYQDTLSENEANAAALAGPTPAEVALESFDRAKDANAAGEVVITGVLDVSAIYTLKQTKNGREKGKQWIAPLRPLESADDPSIHAVVFEGTGEDPIEKILTDQGQAGVTEFGPMVRVHGVLTKPSSSLREQVADAFGDEKLTVADDVIYIDPFMASREQELKQQDPMGAPIVAGGLGGVLILYGFLRMAFRRRN